MTTSADHEAVTCDVALSRAFGFLGKRWTGLIIGVLSGGPLGFAALARAVQGISDSVLSERLTELCRAGLVSRSVDPGPPVAVSYELSESGRALMPALRELIHWGRQHPVDAGDC